MSNRDFEAGCSKASYLEVCQDGGEPDSFEVEVREHDGGARDHAGDFRGAAGGRGVAEGPVDGEQESHDEVVVTGGGFKRFVAVIGDAAFEAGEFLKEGALIREIGGDVEVPISRASWKVVTRSRLGTW